MARDGWGERYFLSFYWRIVREKVLISFIVIITHLWLLRTNVSICLFSNLKIVRFNFIFLSWITLLKRDETKKKHKVINGSKSMRVTDNGNENCCCTRQSTCVLDGFLFNHSEARHVIYRNTMFVLRLHIWSAQGDHRPGSLEKHNPLVYLSQNLTICIVIVIKLKVNFLTTKANQFFFSSSFSWCKH